VSNGDTVELIASPEPGSALTSWYGCTTVSGNSCFVKMTAQRSVTATFQPAPGVSTSAITVAPTVAAVGVGAGGTAGGCSSGAGGPLALLGLFAAVGWRRRRP
jgi:MYXO-CTERM domain-containing protein